MKNDLPTKGCGGLSDVQICLHAPKADMQTYLYGTAKETEQMLNRFPQIIAPKYLHYKMKNNMPAFHCRVCQVPLSGGLRGADFLLSSHKY